MSLRTRKLEAENNATKTLYHDVLMEQLQKGMAIQQ